MRRTRIVGWLRVILPLLALAILSTLFLFSSRPDSDGSALPYADVSPQELAGRPVITQPSYAGVASDGTEIEMTAASVNPDDDEGRSQIAQVQLILRAADGLVAELTAGEGEKQGQLIRLAQDVTMTTSTGWRLVADEFLARADDGVVTSDRPVHVQGPFGELEAGGMSLRRMPDNPENHVLDLNGGVRMIYRP